MRIHAAVIAVLALVHPAFALGGDKPAKKPNIVYILADDVGYGDLGCTGHPYARTPAIDRFAKQGAFFKNFYVSGPVCSPSRTGMMTGRFPGTFQKIPASHGFSGALTITEVLRRAGYRTGHFGKWHIGPEQAAGTYGIEVLREIKNDRKEPRGRDTPITDAAIAFLKANKDTTFYLNVWYHTVHNPVNPPQSYVDRFKSLKVNPMDFKNPDEVNELIALKKSGEDIDAGMRKHVGDMEQLDDQVARLLKSIDDLGLADNTIVVFTSDNGPHGYGSSGIFRGKKHSLYDGGVHLPLMVRWPGRIPPGRVDEKSVLAGVDWLPTLATIAGAKIDAKDAAKLDGEDMSDVWLDKQRPRTKDLFWRTFAPKNQPVMLRGQWKLHTQRKGAPELYDLAKDPSQRLNVADQQPNVVREMTAALNRWTATLPKTYTGFDNDKD